MRVAEHWFDVRQVDDGVLRITEPHVHPLLRSNLYLVRGSERDLLVDAGCGIASLRTELADLFERPVVAVATHRHEDHVGGMPEFEEIVAHRLDAPSLKLADGFASLVLSDYEPSFVGSLAASGYELTELLIDALPSEDYDPAAYRLPSVTPTRVVDEGDVVTTGAASSRSCIFLGTPRVRSACGKRSREASSRVIACTSQAISWMNCPSRTSLTTCGACGACATFR